MLKIVARTGLVGLLAVVVSGCSSASPGVTDNGGGGGNNNGASQGIALKVTLNLSGPDPVQGTFTDVETVYSSCSQYATMNTALGWIGPAPADKGGTTAQVGGKTVSWNLVINKADFHGPGTYSNANFGALVIGSDDYSKLTATVTLNADGSGQGSVADGRTFNGPSGTESGTFSWTCASS